MTIWPPSPDRLKRPVYRSIAQALVDAVDAGEIGDGAKLPPHRTLAFRLGVSVHTVSRAYEELTRIGLIKGQVGRGSFVTVQPRDAPTPWQAADESEDVIDLSMLVPVLGPRHEQLMRDALAKLAKDLPFRSYGSFRPRTSLRHHCDVAKQWLDSCGVQVGRDRILPTNGCTSAMSIALMAAAIPGDLILTEAIGHHTLKALGHALGMRLSGVATDDQGLIPEAVDEAAAHGARAIFVMPAGLGPTTACMGAQRREALVEVARRHDLMIIENDAWAPLVPHNCRPLVALAPERTLYMTGLSKFTVPGLRIGWLVLPDRLVAAARARHLVTAWMVSPLIAEIAARWIADGTVSELLDFQKQQLARRNALARRALDGLDFRALDTGMHVWLTLPEGWREVDFVTHARNERVAVAGARSFEMGEVSGTNGVRICLGGVSELELAQGLRTLFLLAKGTPEPVLLTM